MATTYTRAEIRRAVGQEIRDENAGLFSNAKKNRAISWIHREFVEYSECNRNVLVFSLADATSDGTIEYDRNENAPSITYIDVEGRSYYQIDNCVLVESIRLWDDDSYDWKELAPLTQFEIDRMGLLQDDNTVPIGYQQLASPDTFQILPALDYTSDTYKFEVRYIEGARDLVTYDGSPTDSTVVQTTGNGLSDFTAAVTAVKIPCKFRITILTAGSVGPPLVEGTVKTEKDIYDGNGWVVVTASEALTGAAQALAHGATYTAAATTGHTVADVFEFAVDDYQIPSMPSQYRHVLLNGVCARLLRGKRDTEYQTYLAQYERDKERIRRKVRRLNSDQAPRFRNDYCGSGG